MFKRIHFSVMTIHVGRLYKLHQHLVILSCKSHVYLSTARVPVRKHSAFSKKSYCECNCSRLNESLVKTLKTKKIRTDVLKGCVRLLHDDISDKGENSSGNVDANLEDKLEDSVLEDELGVKVMEDELEDNVFEDELDHKIIEEDGLDELDSLEHTAREQKQRRSKTPNLHTSESSASKNSAVLSSETDYEESGIGKDDGQQETDAQNENKEAKEALVSNGRNGHDEWNIVKFMTDSGMLYEIGHTGYLTLCPKFGKLAMKKKNKKKEDRLYINSTSGYFYCRHCGCSGNWAQLKDNIEYIKTVKATRRYECFKNIPDVGRETDEIPHPVRRQLSGAQDFSDMTDETFDTVMSMFEWHGIEKKTFIAYGVKYKASNNEYTVIFPTYSPTTDSVTSVNVYTGKLTEDGDIKTDPVHSYPRGKVAHLFGWQDGKNLRQESKETLVITTSEADAMAVWQATGFVALSLKNISQLPHESLPHLEDFSKIILWLGTDVKAWDNTKIFAKKLGDKRCYVFRPTVLKYMPLEVLQMGDRIQDVLYFPKLMSHNSIVTFGDVRQEVFSEFAHFKQVAGVQWKRYKKLNALLKGHRRGELTILTGPTGSGKTTFMSEYSLDLCMQGVNTLWGSFEISNVRLIKMMMNQFAGKSISKHLNEFDEIADGFSGLPLYFMMYYGQEKLKNVLEAMSHAVYIHDIGHVVVDNLQFMMGMDFTEKNRFFKQDQIVSEFRNFATEKNCHVTLIIHPRKVNVGEELSTASVFGSAKVTQEADNILLIQDQITSRSSRKYIQVAKNRFDGDLGVMTLTFNKESLTFTTVDKKKVTKTEEEQDVSEQAEDVT